MSLITGEGYGKRDKTKMASHAHGSGSLLTEPTFCGNIHTEKQYIRSSRSFDSLIERLNNRNNANQPIIGPKQALASGARHGYTRKFKPNSYEKLNKETMETVSTHNDVQSADDNILIRGEAGPTATGSSTMTPGESHVNPRKSASRGYEKLNKATMEAASCPTEPRSTKRPDSGYEHLNRNTMDSKPTSDELRTNERIPYGYEKLNRKTMESTELPHSGKLQIRKDDCLCDETMDSKIEATLNADLTPADITNWPASASKKLDNGTMEMMSNLEDLGPDNTALHMRYCEHRHQETAVDIDKPKLRPRKYTL